MKQAAKSFLLLSGLLLDLGLSFDSQDGGNTFLRNVVQLVSKIVVCIPEEITFYCDILVI
jgi:hypothetical protein